MDEPHDTTDRWTDLPLPDPAEVSQERVALALRYAMHLAGQSRRGFDLDNAMLSSAAHLLEARDGLLARADATSLANHAAPDPQADPTSEPTSPPDVELPGSSTGTAAAESTHSVAGWHLLAIRSDGVAGLHVSDARLPDSVDSPPAHPAAPIQVVLALGPLLASLSAALLAGVQSESDNASDAHRVIRAGDAVVSVVRVDPVSARQGTSTDHGGPDSPLTPKAGDAPAAHANAPDAVASTARGTVGRSARAAHAVPSSARLAIDSALLRAAMLNSAGNPPGTATSATATTTTTKKKTDGLAADAADVAAPGSQATWSLLALKGVADGAGVAVDAGLVALVHAFHRAAVDVGLLADAKPDLLASLSTGERETVQLLLTGKSETVIARMLGRSPHTVHSHVKRVYRKLGVASRAELMAKLLPG